MNRKLFHFILAAAVFTGCSKGDDSGPDAPGTERGMPLQVMAVFAPGQLGDNGYADGVMQGINYLKDMRREFETDDFDVQFLSSSTRSTTLQSMIEWAEHPVNLFYGHDYERRLLVLTESFMIPWLDKVKDMLRPDDEVLLLKVNEADVTAAAAASGLGERVHGLNISAASSIRKFCRYIDRHLIASPEVDQYLFTLFRLYDDETMAYRDSILETIAEESSSMWTMTTEPLSDEEGEGLYTPKFWESVTSEAYKWASTCQTIFDAVGFNFTIVDTGAANSSFDYFLLDRDPARSFTALILDAKDNGLPRYCIERDFFTAVFTWIGDWTRQNPGAMPRMDLHGGWDEYCIDNIPDE